MTYGASRAGRRDVCAFAPARWRKRTTGGLRIYIGSASVARAGHWQTAAEGFGAASHKALTATMKTALLMSCAASALRLAPTMVLQPRRDLLAGGAAAAASTLLVPEALAKKPLCLPGTNSAKALGGPGYTIGILVARCVEIDCNALLRRLDGVGLTGRFPHRSTTRPRLRSGIR